MAKIVKKRTYHPSRLAESINPASSPAVRHMRVTAQQMTQNANLKIPGPEGTRGSATRRGLASSIRRERSLAREAAKSKPEANVRRVDPNQMKSTIHASQQEQRNPRTGLTRSESDRVQISVNAKQHAKNANRINEIEHTIERLEEIRTSSPSRKARHRASTEIGELRREQSGLESAQRYLKADTERRRGGSDDQPRAPKGTSEGEATGDALNAANRSLVDQKAEAARTFAEARALDAELKRVDEQYMRGRQYYREAKKAGDEVDAARIKEKLARVEAKADEIERKREALKKSGAPAMWGDQPRNELGQFWFK